jgi:uracil-DNA glycosylase
MFDPPPRINPACHGSLPGRGQDALSNSHNGAVAPFGSLDAKLLIVGLAPGMRA